MPLEQVSTAPVQTSTAAPAPELVGQVSHNPPAPAKPPEGVPLDGITADPKTVAKFAELSSSERAAKAEVARLTAELEAARKTPAVPADTAARLERLTAIEAAKAAGKPMQALKLLEIEFDAVVADQLATEPDAPASPEAVKALQEIEAIKKDLEAQKTQTAEEKAKQAEAHQAQQVKLAGDYVAELIKGGADKWPKCAAAPDAVQKVMEAAKAKRFSANSERVKNGEQPLGAPSAEDAEKAIREELDALEIEYEVRAEVESRRSGQVQSIGAHSKGMEVREITLDGGNGGAPSRPSAQPARVQLSARDAKAKAMAMLND